MLCEATHNDYCTFHGVPRKQKRVWSRRAIIQGFSKELSATELLRLTEKLDDWTYCAQLRKKTEKKLEKHGYKSIPLYAYPQKDRVIH